MKGLILFMIGLIVRAAAFTQVQHALIIGIDKYQPPAGTAIPKDAGRIEFNDLDGCRNDALAIKSLICARFGFLEKNINELYNEKAGRENIIQALQSLLTVCKRNDIAFFYYAGHGSQQRNSKSKEADKKDESIVPSDTWKKGVEDIRDKEFARICNAFLDKGVKLTVIFDCCHSGSMSRGVQYNIPKFRYAIENNDDANDPSDPAPPEQRKEGGFLIMSAAQDNETAEEQTDNDHISHGAFTLALITALNQQSVDASAASLFSSTRAILKSNGKMQEPVLGAMPGRQTQTLFGMGKGMLQDKTLIAMTGVRNNKVELQGGFAESLSKDHELNLVNNDSVVVRIDSVYGINRSMGSVIHGNIKSLKPGMLFEISNWISPHGSLLKLYIPSTSFSNLEILKFSDMARQLKSGSKPEWINDVEKKDPQMTVWFRDDTCYFSSDKNGNIKAKECSLLNIRQSVGTGALFFNIPPGRELSSKLKEKFARTGNVEIVSNPNAANYVLYGTIGADGKTSYGLMRAQAAARDSLEAMPVQTKSFALKENTDQANGAVADSICEYALRLSKIRGWLNLSGPKGNQFPFHIELVNDATHRKMDTMQYRVNDHISFHLVIDKNIEGYYIPRKYVYVFAIDRNGEMTLGYPDAGAGNVENKFPVYDNGGIVEDALLFSYSVSEPVGTDYFYLLACNEPIEDYGMMFNQPGVRQTIFRGAGNPLANLLNMGNENATWYVKSAGDWKLIRLPVKTTH